MQRRSFLRCMERTLCSHCLRRRPYVWISMHDSSYLFIVFIAQHTHEQSVSWTILSAISGLFKIKTCIIQISSLTVHSENIFFYHLSDHYAYTIIINYVI